MISSLERHLHQAEITVNYYNHRWWASAPTWISSPPSIPPSRSWRSRPSRSAPSGGTPSARRARGPPPTWPGAPSGRPANPRNRKILRINHHERRKPMTLEEALLQMEKGARLPGLSRRGDQPRGRAGAPPRRQFRSDRGLTRRMAQPDPGQATAPRTGPRNW